MPMTFPDAPGRSFMHCWGFRGVSAYSTSGEKKKDSLISFGEGFVRDGFGDDVFDLYTDESGNIDIVTAGKSGLSYLKDGFRIYMNNPKKLNFYSDYQWSQKPGSDSIKVVASYYEEESDFQNEVEISFLKKKDSYSSSTYTAIYTKNLMRGSKGLVDPYISGAVMYGNCMAK
jgi:hypothetical protein